jgi:hypothetical protein
MIEMYAIFAVTLLLAGAVIGFLVVISLGIHREESALTVTTPTSDRLTGGVRAVNGMTSRTPGVLPEVRLQRLHRQEHLPVEDGSEAAA